MGTKEMNTFLPYPSFDESAKVLDNKRLGKQRVEAYQILKTLQKGPKQCSFNKNHWVTYNINPSNPKQKFWLCTVCEYSPKNTPWYNHPAVQMWKGYEEALAAYGIYTCGEWQDRGFRDTMENKIEVFAGSNGLDILEIDKLPKWLGNKDFHASHRSNLLRKDPKYYGQFGWKEPDDLPYYWPTKEGY